MIKIEQYDTTLRAHPTIKMLLMKNLQKLVRDKVEQCGTTLRAQGYSVPPISVLFNLKGNTAGKAGWSILKRTYQVRINLFYLRTHPDDMLDDTVPHEVAHIVSFLKGTDLGVRRQLHGHYWKEVMGALGVIPTRCHAYGDSPEKQIKHFDRFEFTCAAHGNRINFTRTLIGKMGKRNYLIKKCRCPIEIKKIKLEEIKSLPPPNWSSII